MHIDPHSIWVIGVSMTKFGRYPDKTAYDLGAEAALAALDDAGVEVTDLDVVAAGSVNQARGYPAQSIQKLIGQTGIPAYNVLNACATGATAVRVVHQAIKAGEATIGLAVGCEQMGKMGLLGGAPSATKTFTHRRRRHAPRRRLGNGPHARRLCASRDALRGDA
jgi:acetyl-CoA acetyltransferase